MNGQASSKHAQRGAQVEDALDRQAQRRGIEALRKHQPGRIDQREADHAEFALEEGRQRRHRDAYLLAGEQFVHRQTDATVIGTDHDFVDLQALRPHPQRTIQRQQPVRRHRNGLVAHAA